MAGATIALVGVTGSYYIQAAVYAWATLWTIQMKVPNSNASRESVASTPNDSQFRSTRDDNSTADRPTMKRVSRANDSFFGSLKEGFQYVLKNSLILSLMFLALAPTLLGMPFASLMPLFALDVLHGTSIEQGMLLSSVGVGALIGALAIASVGSFRRKGMLLLAGATMFGLSLIAFSQSKSMPFALFFLLIVGISNASYGSQNQTIIQSLAPANLRGRVMSIYMLNQGLMPVGALLAGFLAHWLGGPWAVSIMGAGCTAVALSVAFIRPEIREIDI
jgi:Na+/melibiose symporter-like transporter